MSERELTWLEKNFKPVPVSILLISVAVTFLNYLFFRINSTLIFDPLFFIPILLVAYYYPKRARFAAVVFALIYLLMVLLIFSRSWETLITGLEHAGLFIIVGFIASYLSIRSPQELKVYRDLTKVFEPLRIKILVLPALIITITAAIFFLNFLVLQVNESVIFDPLFYFPIILVAYFYPNRGIVASTVIAVLFLVMVMITPQQTMEIVITSTGHACLFIIIGFVVSYLSLSFSKEHAIHERLAELVESSGDAIIGVTLDGTVTDWNRGAQRLFQYESRQITGKNVKTLFSDGAADTFQKTCEQIEQGRPVQTVEMEWKKKDGEPVSISISVSPINNTRGDIVGASIIAQDITERKRAEEALKMSKRRLTDIINHLPDATFAIDDKRVVIAWNKGMEEMTGVKASDILGKGDYAYAIPFYGEKRPLLVDLVIGTDADVERLYPRIEQMENKLISEVFIPRLYNGRGAYVWFFASPLFDADGNVIGAIETIRDITGRKQMENSLELANKKIHLLNSITRHDILNQIMALNVCIDMSRESVHDPEVLSLLGQARRASQNISEQISFTKEYQDIGVKTPEWQNVRDTLLKAFGSLNTGAITIQPCTKGLEIFADPLFEKVFYNLIDNSLKHGEKITLIRCSDREGESGLTLVYEDDGVGISMEDKPKIFRKGFGKNSGLGLFLIREILAITGITITENGEPGKGARFEITIPKGGYRYSPHGP